MRWVPRIAATLCLTALIAIGLSYFARLDGGFQPLPKGVAAFSTVKAEAINDKTLVDWLDQLTLHSTLKKVDWNHSILWIDLQTVERAPQKDQIFEDLQTIARFGFVNASNVKQVWVRVLSRDGTASGKLLLAMTGYRSELGKDSRSELKSGKAQPQKWFDAAFHMTYTEEWKRQFEKNQVTVF